ncbi:uncharacterized protein [Aquarana catesbeiana]|uniref:uncharacterized protein isoform X2 n=1 Tax=Aquarana catesbeiana TaxID=8400 RepID=UPI003CC93EAE
MFTRVGTGLLLGSALQRSPMFWWNRNRKYPTGTPLTPFLLLGAVCLGEIRVTSIAYDTARLPCSFNFIQGAEHLLVLWEKEGKDGKSVQVYKFENGEVNLTNQDSQFRGRTVFSGDVSLGKLDLTLVGLTQNDDAVYYCRAANKINHGDNTVVLSVIALPPLMVQKVVEDNVTLVPKFSGVPTEINWKLNNNKLVDMELKPLERHFYRLADRAELQLNGSLTIRNLTKEDSGAYKSEAIVNNFIQETEIRLSVFDRVSKPIISDSSTDEQIILHCESSTINVSYKWLVNGRETETTEQDYKAPRPEEDVVVSCSVNNTVSKDSQSIPITTYKTGFRRHRFYTIFAVVLFLLFLIVILNVRCFIQVFWCERCWKFKKYERDDVEPIAYSPSNGKNLPEISERGRGYMCDENRDKICIDGFQKTEEDQRDAAELKYTGGLRPKQVLLRLSSDNDYFSDQSKEAPESDCVLEGDLASDNPQHVAGDVASDNLHLVTSDVASDNPQHTAGDVASDNLHLVTGDVASDNPQHVAGDMASDNLHLVTSDVASDTHLRLPLILHYGFQKTKRDKRDAAAPEYIANVQSDGYLKFYKTSSDSDYISKKSEEAPEPFRVLEGFQKTERDKRDAAAPEYIANVQSDGYLKFYKTSSDSDYISKKSEEAPEPFRVLEVLH